jgi:hypothetical protein
MRKTLLVLPPLNSHASPTRLPYVSHIKALLLKGVNCGGGIRGKHLLLDTPLRPLSRGGLFGVRKLRLGKDWEKTVKRKINRNNQPSDRPYVIFRGSIDGNIR